MSRKQHLELDAWVNIDVMVDVTEVMQLGESGIHIWKPGGVEAWIFAVLSYRYIFLNYET